MQKMFKNVISVWEKFLSTLYYTVQQNEKQSISLFLCLLLTPCCQTGAFCLNGLLSLNSIGSGREKKATPTNDLFIGTPHSHAVCYLTTFPDRMTLTPLWSHRAPPHQRKTLTAQICVRSCRTPGIGQGF